MSKDRQSSEAEASDPVDPVAAAVDYLKATIRKETRFRFHDRAVYLPQLQSKLNAAVGLPLASTRAVRTVFESAVAEIRRQCPGLKVELRGYRQDEISAFDLSLEGSTEWDDVQRYAHGVDNPEAPAPLSEPASRLLERLESGELNGFQKDLGVRQRIRLFGWGADYEAVLQEIRNKVGIEITLATKGEDFPKRRHWVKFTIAARHPPGVLPSSLGFVVPDDVFNNLESEQSIKWFLKMLADATVEGSSPYYVWYLPSKREFFRCFPAAAKADKIDNSITALLSLVSKRAPYLKFSWDFGHTTAHWFATVAPQSTWGAAKEAIHAYLNRPSSESLYGLSAEAAVLYDWVCSLEKDRLEFGLTPPVQDAIQNRSLLLRSKWHADNFPLFLELLCEEVSAKTPVSLRAAAWHDSGRIKQRIQVKTKSAT